MNERERLQKELLRVENLRDRERIREDYYLDSVLANLFVQDEGSYLSSEDGEMSSEEQYQYDIIHAEDSELTSGYTTISSN